MVTALVALHIMVSLALIFIVLVQGGKGAELGAAFGAGSSQTVFGGRGAATFLNKATTVVAVVFMLPSLLLAAITFKGHSIVQSTKPVAAVPSPTTEGAVPVAPTAPATPIAPGQAAPAETPVAPPSQ